MHEKLRDKFTFDYKAGQGGMAEIYKVTEKATLKKFAIKILHPDKKDSYSDKRRFLGEINLTKKVDSPYVVRVFDWVWDDDVQYILMEHIDGMTLRDYIGSKSRLTVDEAVEFTKQIALGFEAIHKAGIVHRDIKATNIMVTNHGQIKIIDFGIAIDHESERLTKTDNIVASPQYLAPELVELEQASVQSDIYSLGILMFEMLTGSLPYNGKNQMETVLMHKNKTVPQVNKVFSNIPQALANVVIRATAKDKSKRYKTMYELYRDVNTCLSNERLHEPVYSLQDKQKKSFMQIINSKWTLVGIISSILIVLIIVIVVLAVKVI